jgi:hypothetical protein
MCAAVLTTCAGLALAGPADPVPVGEGWLYPAVDFQDGRTRGQDGEVRQGVSEISEGFNGDPEDHGPWSACFAEGYTPTQAEWDALHAAMANGYVSRYNIGGRWPGSTGSPISLTWSFIPDGVMITGGLGGDQPSVLFSRMNTLFGAPNQNTWITQITNAMNRWAQISGITYTRIQFNGNQWDDGAAWGSSGSANLRGDIRIGMKNIDGVNGVLAYNTFPGSGTGGDMVIDSSESWNNSSGTYRFLRNVVAHENGHGLGFSHVCPANATKLMEPFVSTSYDGQREDDLRAVQHNYGDPYESNNSAATATDLGTLVAGTTTTIGTVPAPAISTGSMLSLHPNDTDYFRINLTEPRLVNITITPVGSTYIDVDQNSDGSCQTSGTTVNAAAVADLVLRAYQSNGTTELRAQNATAAGSPETITGLLMSNGTNFVRVAPNASNSQTQCYTLAITVTNTNLACSATDGTLPDRVRITWPSVPDATGYIVMRNTTNSTSGATTLATLGVVTTYDDLTAATGTVYYYFVRVQQLGNSTYRYMTLTGDPGFVGAANQPPVANAGPDLVLQDADNNGSEGTTLDGSASTDPDGTIVNYTWTMGATTLGSSSLPTLFSIFPAGENVVTLTVTDNSGASDSDDVIITVNRRPTANAGPDAIVDDIDDNGDESVTLDGSASTDPDGTIVNYRWTRGVDVLADGSDATPTIDLAWGLHTITLTVTDNLGGTHTDDVTIFVNRRPVANAGPDQVLVDADQSGDESVTLDGSASTDPDGTITNYLWELGTTTLASGSNPVAVVTLPLGFHVVTLTVTDNRGSTTSDDVFITIQSAGTPCDPDYNQDGNVDQDDIACLAQIIAGDPSCSDIDPDFNGDGNVDQDDIAALTDVVAGGPCP